MRIVQKVDDINRVEVYSLKENCWKEINVELEIGLVGEPLTSVNGSIYWLAGKRPHDFGLVVLSFNVQSLSFCTIQLPDDLSALLCLYQGRKNHKVGLLQFKEYVALFYRFDQGGLVIYTLFDGNCWCKNMTVKRLNFLAGCLKTGELIGWKYRYDYQGSICYLLLYDSVNNVVKSIRPVLKRRRILYHYTESLLDLN